MTMIWLGRMLLTLVCIGGLAACADDSRPMPADGAATSGGASGHGY